MNDNLLLYIIGRLEEEGANSLTLRLVKLLYLTDVEYYRNYGQTITGLNWIFYKYGPYEMAFPDIFQRLDLEIDYEQVITQAGHRGRKFSLKIPLQEVQNRLPTKLRFVVDRIINVLGLEDINVILDYVYFHTEPMINAEWMKPLDFSKIEVSPVEGPIWMSLPKGKVKMLRSELMETLAELDKQKDEIRLPQYYDSIYHKAIEEMDSESDTSQLHGKKLNMNTGRLLHQSGD